MKNDSSRSGLSFQSQSLTEKQGRPPNRPSIAVLPFTDLDEESKQDRIGNRLSDDVTHHLSRFRHFSVLGNSAHLVSFREQRTLEAIGRSLGTRYLVIGSIRFAGDQLQAMAYLIDSASGKQLWFSPYSKVKGCSMEFEDDLATDIATGVALSIDAAECARFQDHNDLDGDPETTPLILMADQLTKQFQRHANERARKLIKKVLSIDPMSARAYAVLSRTHHLDSRYAWTSDPDKSSEHAIEFADLATRLDPMEASGYAELGMSQHYRREYDSAFAAYRRALDINPNDPDTLADFADFLITDGTPELAIEPLTMAIHLRPERAGMYRYYLAGAFVDLRDDEMVIRLLTANDGNLEGHRMLAASYARLGKPDKAAFYVDMAIKAHPNFSLVHWQTILPHRDPDARAYIIEGMERAGLQ